MNLSDYFKAIAEHAVVTFPRNLELGKVVIVKTDLSDPINVADILNPLHQLVVDSEECVVVRSALNAGEIFWSLNVGLYRKAAWEATQNFSRLDWENLDHEAKQEMATDSEHEKRLREGDYVSLQIAGTRIQIKNDILQKLPSGLDVNLGTAMFNFEVVDQMPVVDEAENVDWRKIVPGMRIACTDRDLVDTKTENSNMDMYVTDDDDLWLSEPRAAIVSEIRLTRREGLNYVQPIVLVPKLTKTTISPMRISGLDWQSG